MKPKTIRFLPFLYTIFQTTPVFSQIAEHSDYIGAGHNNGVVVRTSSYFQKEDRRNQADGQSTLNGAGLDARKMEAARFLSQAAFGGSTAEINGLALNLDFSKWIEHQSSLPVSNMQQEVDWAYYWARDLFQQQNPNSDNYSNRDRHFHYAWWSMVMTNPDKLRQRIAMALSEILVISTRSPIRNNGSIYASYYDIFLRNAFGNYKDILTEVSLHPAMGVYLTHFRNPKGDTLANTFPDENYAREIMQLFTIGLFELNNDGSLKTDGNGNPIPTYGLEDTRELARVFTGLGAGGLTADAQADGQDLSFNTRENRLDYLVPMLMYEEQHEPGEKTILQNHIIPSGQTGMEDIHMAIDILFNHPNVGPFISRKLIQHFVKSNPSSVYIDDVAGVFNDNGEGVRGDMKAVIKAILLHEEARSCLWQNDPMNGKLKSPVLRFSAIARGLEKAGRNTTYFTETRGLLNNTDHRVLTSPSVFNFYLPDHRPNGPMAELGLYGPEFEIYNSVTSIGYVNEVDSWTRRGNLFVASETPAEIELDKGAYYEMARDPEVLINHIDAYFLQGRLSENTREIMRETLVNTPDWNEESQLRMRVELAFYLAFISPEFNILK